MSEQHPLMARVLRAFGLAPPEPVDCPGCGKPPFARTLPYGEGEAGCRRCGCTCRQAEGAMPPCVRGTRGWSERR